MRQAALARRDHVAELFNRAVGQLKDDRIEIRLAAVYTLDQICRDFPDLSDPVIQLMTAYLREGADEYGDREPPVDVREIAGILRERPEQPR